MRQRLDWIARLTLSRSALAEYHHATRTCAIDFIEPSPEYDQEYLVGLYACTLVHEATHGVIRSRGIFYTPKLRFRIERLCFREEQRFLIHLTITRPELAERLYSEFDASRWKEAWNETPGDRLRAQMRRSILGK